MSTISTSFPYDFFSIRILIGLWYIKFFCLIIVLDIHHFTVKIARCNYKSDFLALLVSASLFRYDLQKCNFNHRILWLCNLSFFFSNVFSVSFALGKPLHLRDFMALHGQKRLKTIE